MHESVTGAIIGGLKMCEVNNMCVRDFFTIEIYGLRNMDQSTDAGLVGLYDGKLLHIRQKLRTTSAVGFENG